MGSDKAGSGHQEEGFSTLCVLAGEVSDRLCWAVSDVRGDRGVTPWMMSIVIMQR